MEWSECNLFNLLGVLGDFKLSCIVFIKLTTFTMTKLSKVYITLFADFENAFNTTNSECISGGRCGRRNS